MRLSANDSPDTRRRRRRGSRIAVLAVVASLGASGASAQGGAASPQALLEAAREAAADPDGRGLARFMAPSKLHLLALETDMAAEFMSELSEDEETKRMLAQGLPKLRDQYGVSLDAVADQEPLQVTPDTPPEEIEAHADARARRIYENVDLVGYVGEISALLMSTPDMTGQPRFPPGEISDVQVDGDRATAQVGEQAVTMVREEGRWYLAPPGS